MDEKFYTERKEIGIGRWGNVFLWNGFAYKCFDKTTSIESIEREIFIQNEINKTNLPTVKYYKTDDPFIIKMDYIDGMTLAQRIAQRSYSHGIEDLISLQKQIHQIHNINIPTLRNFAEPMINTIPDTEQRKRVLRYLYEIAETDNLCHLDLHPLNVMFANGRYYIVDWMSASLGNPVIDYARSYILLHLHNYDMSQKYMSLLEQDETIDMTDIDKALYIAALTSADETNYEILRKFLE